MNQEKLAKLQAQVRIGGKVIAVKMTTFPFFARCYVICPKLYCQISAKLNDVGKNTVNYSLRF